MTLGVKRRWGGAYGLLCTYNKLNNSTEIHSRFLLNYLVFFWTDHPYITSESPHVHQVQEGRRTSYPCPIDGNPPPDFKWYTGNGTSLLKNSGKNLSISETLSTNSGWYTCQATNKLGDKIIRLHLIGELECCLQIT